VLSVLRILDSQHQTLYHDLEHYFLFKLNSIMALDFDLESLVHLEQTSVSISRAYVLSDLEPDFMIADTRMVLHTDEYMA
jgi:hypothetical protein